MKTHIIDALRPERPDLDPDWEAETVRSILEDRAGVTTTEHSGSRRLMRVALVAAAVVAIIGAAVVARNSLPADVVRPAAPKQEKIQNIDPAKATKLKLGDTLDVVAELPQTFNGDQVLFSAFAEDNVLVGSAAPVDNGVSVQQAHPVMYDLGTKKITLLDDRDRPEPTQVVDVSGNEDTVVWTELVGTNIDTSNFTIHSYDRRTKQVTTLGTFDDPRGAIVYGRDLAIAGDTAYFSTPAYPAKEGQEAVYAVPVDGSKPASVIAKPGQDVRISGNTLTYAVRNPKDKNAYPTYFTYDLRTEVTTPAPVSTHANDSGFCGAEFTKAWETWCEGVVDDAVRSEPGLLTIKEASGRTTAFAPFPASPNAPHNVMTLGPWTAITVTTTTGQNREYLVDLDTKEVKVFPGNSSFAALSPDRSTALITSYASKGPGPERIVRIPGK
ncbi:MAG: hypothetical protein QOJ72_2973 [Nocardioidaceae bacterium]|nr:hypothetical protein [Nocardioidaceae bacterium]